MVERLPRASLQRSYLISQVACLQGAIISKYTAVMIINIRATLDFVFLSFSKVNEENIQYRNDLKPSNNHVSTEHQLRKDIQVYRCYTCSEASRRDSRGGFK